VLAICETMDPYFPVRYRVLETLPETFPPADIFGIDISILECFSGTSHLVDPKLVHLDVASSHLISNNVHLPKQSCIFWKWFRQAWDTVLQVWDIV
jgi:hypothetical protein